MHHSHHSVPLFESASTRIVRNRHLREPQRLAYMALRQHFLTSREPAVIQIPVGCGKTGLISILPFGISRSRVLIVAPNLTIRDALFAAVDCGNLRCFFRRYNVADMKPEGPFAAVIDGRDANLIDCQSSHFVVTNIQQLAQADNRWLRSLSADFFDLIIFDEGHHNAARSWQRLIEHFRDARIVSLTATPFRSDNRALTGKLIYSYPLLRAMRRGYIKILEARHVAPAELAFTFADTHQTATLNEILELREETWFRRGVALADTCNRSIVQSSLQACEELRRRTGKHQQIIAAACSVEHAETIAALYREVGYSAEAIHSGLPETNRRNVIQRLRNGTLDAIIQVQMLGEGFDHPPLSVAAVFRPFRTLAPFVQFVGRIMRVISQNQPLAPENRGIVVSHVGLNTDRHWDQFRLLDAEDQSLIAGILNGHPSVQLPETSETHSPGTDLTENAERRFRPEMLVEWETIAATTSETFSENHSSELSDEIPDPPEELKTRPPIIGQIAGPQQRRREARSQLKTIVEQHLRVILNRARLNSSGRQIARYFPRFRHLDNWSALRYWLYIDLNRAIRRRPGTSDQWSLDDVESAIRQLPRIVSQIERELEQRRMNNRKRTERCRQSVVY